MNPLDSISKPNTVPNEKIQSSLNANPKTSVPTGDSTDLKITMIFFVFTGFVLVKKIGIVVTSDK